MRPLLALLALAGCPRIDDSGTDCVPGELGDHQGITMARLCPGSFTMGSPEDEIGRADGEDQRSVTLTRGFHIGIHEVTQQQFEAFQDYLPRNWPDCGDTPCAIQNVSSQEAQTFANAVSAAAGLAECYRCEIWCDNCYPFWQCDWNEAWETPYDCPGYRLPTEAEWEYAARAGTTSAFSTGGNLREGDEFECEDEVVLDDGTKLDDIARYCQSEPPDGFAYEVGLRLPNPWGLYDMHGNVAEWVEDGFEISPGGGDDPWVPDRTHRVVKCGAWDKVPRSARSAYRDWQIDNYLDWGVGFRLARSE